MGECEMPEYTVIRVRKEIAQYYFHKSDILYRFFMTHKYNEHKDYLKRQYSYITKIFSVDELVCQLRDVYSSRSIAFQKRSDIEISTEEHKMSLHISEKQIKFWCDTMLDAEVLLFPALRNVYSYLFVVCEDRVNYGWVSPIITKNLQKQKQVLYSYH